MLLLLPAVAGATAEDEARSGLTMGAFAPLFLGAFVGNLQTHGMFYVRVALVFFPRFPVKHHPDRRDALLLILRIFKNNF